MNQYPTWKYVALIVAFFIGLLYALPNLYNDVSVVQIAPKGEQKIDAALIEKVKTALQEGHIAYQSIEQNAHNLVVVFSSVDLQLLARDRIQAALNSGAQPDYTVALNLMPTTPKWLAAIGAKPMKLGLDLRGGVHFLLEVDIAGVAERHLQSLEKSIIQALQSEGVRYSGIQIIQKSGIRLTFPQDDMRSKAYHLLQTRFSDLEINKMINNREIVAFMTPKAMTEIRQYTIDQTMTTLRNRINELGIAEAGVQQQGANRIAVDMPGIQDASHAKQILGGTATLAFHLVDMNNDAQAAKVAGFPPIGTKLFEYESIPLLVKNQAVLTGDAIISARSGLDENGMPAVHVMISGGSEHRFNQITRDNIGKPMAIVYIETQTENKIEQGKTIKLHKKTERIISVPRINSALGNNFQITGLNEKEARDLSLLLRAGSLPAAIDIVEESTMGPTLGAENIQKGLRSLMIGMGLIIIFMAIYYRVFGFIADLALILNLIFLVALLSILGATLTLPGIAGIVLTVGMAVDSNVLIFERIREELRNGASAQASIAAGYEKAFATIVDANLTTLIVAIVLFSFGSGAIRGFATNLTLGLITSMFTAITFTRGLVNLVYGKRRSQKIQIGI